MFYSCPTLLNFLAAVKFYFVNDRTRQLQGRSKHFVTQSSEEVLRKPIALPGVNDWLILQSAFEGRV